MDLTGKTFETTDRKKIRKKILDITQKNSWTQGFWGNKSSFPLQTVRFKLNKTWKKAFRSKLLEFCKTRTKKSSPDMFNFYVVLAGHDKVNDAGRATTCRRKFTAPSLQTKCTKNEGPPEYMGFKGKTVWRFQTKKRTETFSRPSKNNPVEYKDPDCVNWRRPSLKVRSKQNKIWKKSIQIKTVGILPD